VFIVVVLRGQEMMEKGQGNQIRKKYLLAIQTCYIQICFISNKIIYFLFSQFVLWAKKSKKIYIIIYFV